MLQKAGLGIGTILQSTCHFLFIRLYAAALQKVAELEAEIRNETEEAEEAEQLSTYLALKEYPQQQVKYCRDAAAKLRRKLVQLVCYQFQTSLH